MRTTYKILLGGIVLLLVCALVYNKCRSDKRVNQVTQYTTKETTPVKRWTDKQGTQHAKAEVQQVPKAVFDQSRDSLIRELKKVAKANNLLQATIIKLRSKDSVFAPYVTTIINDTAIVMPAQFSYTDDCIDLDGSLTDSGVALQYDVHTNVTLVSHWDNPGLFKPKRLYVEALTNQCTAVDTLAAIVVQKPPKKFIETRGFAIGVGFILGVLAGAVK